MDGGRDGWSGIYSNIVKFKNALLGLGRHNVKVGKVHFLPLCMFSFTSLCRYVTAESFGLLILVQVKCVEQECSVHYFGDYCSERSGFSTIYTSMISVDSNSAQVL